MLMSNSNFELNIGHHGTVRFACPYRAYFPCAIRSADSSVAQLTMSEGILLTQHFHLEKLQVFERFEGQKSLLANVQGDNWCLEDHVFRVASSGGAPLRPANERIQPAHLSER